jgi:hypothetical protein
MSRAAPSSRINPATRLSGTCLDNLVAQARLMDGTLPTQSATAREGGSAKTPGWLVSQQAPTRLPSVHLIGFGAGTEVVIRDWTGDTDTEDLRSIITEKLYVWDRSRRSVVADSLTRLRFGKEFQNAAAGWAAEER